MSVFKTTFSRALLVYPSNDANIPYPTVITSGTNTSAGADQLVDNTTDFTLLNIKAGDIVYNTSTSSAATVIKVKDADTLDLNADIFTTDPEAYVIYQASPQSGLGNQGCYLYIGQSTDNNGTIVVTTIGGDTVTIRGVLFGTVLPLQVIKVHSSGTVDISEILALW